MHPVRQHRGLPHCLPFLRLLPGTAGPDHRRKVISAQLRVPLYLASVEPALTRVTLPFHRKFSKSLPIKISLIVPGSVNISSNFFLKIAILILAISHLTISNELYGQTGVVASWGQKKIPISLHEAKPITKIGTGYGHNLALRSDGTVVAWGYNDYDYFQSNPPQGLANVIGIATGDFHNL